MKTQRTTGGIARRPRAALGPLAVRDAAAMEALAGSVAAAGLRCGVVYLVGELGAGKTTFASGMLAGLGVRGPVKSPTYTLVEAYAAGELRIYHLDLYRIADPAELEFIGFHEYLDAGTLCLIEWPERAGGRLPAARLTVEIRYRERHRVLRLKAHDAVAARILGRLEV